MTAQPHGHGEGFAEQADPSPAIAARGLVKRFGQVIALDGLTMTVPRGEVFGFLGPNGAGKTTAVKLLLGLTFPTSGEASVLGAPVGDRVSRRRIGYLPELFRYQDWLTAREVIRFHCLLTGLPRGTWDAQASEVLHTVGLAARSDDKVATYSKGMQQRLGLAVALVGDPDLIVLDEPTSALDPVGRREVRDVLRGLKQRGVTVFLNSHLLTEVEHVCDRVAIVNRGRVIATGAIADLMNETPAVRFRVEAMNDAAAGLLRAFGEVRAVDGAYVVRGIAPDRVPDAVSALVASGTRIRSVEPERRSLEDQFLAVLGGSADAAARDR